MGYKAERNDIIITVLGPRGSGKTRFIEALSGRAQAGSAGNLKDHTKKVTPYIFHYSGSDQLPGRLILVDTPGLQESSCPDAMQLRNTFDKLKAMYSKTGVPLRLAGIICLHQITDNRFHNSSIYKDLGRLCCNTPLSQACLVTTRWGEPGRREVRENRERELENKYWGPLINQGAAIKRFDNTPAAAWEIIAHLLRQNGQTVPQDCPDMEVFVQEPSCCGLF